MTHRDTGDDEFQISRQTLKALIELLSSSCDWTLTQQIHKYQRALDLHNSMIRAESSRYLLLVQEANRLKLSLLTLETQLAKHTNRINANQTTPIRGLHESTGLSSLITKSIATEAQQERSKNPEVFINSYELDQGDHCFEIDNKSTHFTDLALYCEEICQYSERFELLPAALILLPFDIDLSKEMKEHGHLTLYVIARDGSRISNKFRMEFSISMASEDPTDYESLDDSLESYQAPIQVVIDCEDSEGGVAVVRLTNVSHEDVTGTLFSLEDYADLTDELLLQPNVTREVRVKVSASMMTLKFFTSELAELGTFTLTS
jgi:hypothetical protein